MPGIHHESATPEDSSSPSPEPVNISVPVNKNNSDYSSVNSDANLKIIKTDDTILETADTILETNNPFIEATNDQLDVPVGSCPVNISNTIKLIQTVTKSGVPNRNGVQCPVGKLNIPACKHRLEGYSDKEDIIAGNAFGWELGMGDEPVPMSSYRNHPSAGEYEASVDEYIQTELEHGALCGPLPDDSGLDIIISPLATVPKGPGTRRIIVDSSFPPGHGINDSIPKNIYRGQYVKVKLPTVENIVSAIRRVKKRYPGRVIKGFKCDKSRYYRNIPTCPRDWPKQCIKWKGKVYLDKAWSFGIRSAVQAAQRTSDAINWCYCNQEHSGHAPLIREALGIPDQYTDEDIEQWEDPEELFNYIDDYIGIQVDFLADTQWERLQNIIQLLGFPLSNTAGHLVPPSECFKGLGIEFNIPLNLVRIPQDKLDAGKQLILQWETKEEASKTEIQQILGILHHFSGCIKPGRLFVNRMQMDLRAAYKVSPKKIQLSNGFKKGLWWWKYCMGDHNGFPILDHRQVGATVTMDASSKGEVGGLPGVAAYNFNTNEYFHRPVPSWLLGLDICDYELIVHLICAKVWGSGWTGSQIEGHTDNSATFFLLKNGRSEVEFRL